MRILRFLNQNSDFITIKRSQIADLLVVKCVLVTKACIWCKKESSAFLVFFKPRGWIKHRTRDGIDMLFCSLACFKAYIGAEPVDRSRPIKKPIEEQEEQLLAPVAR